MKYSGLTAEEALAHPGLGPKDTTPSMPLRHQVQQAYFAKEKLDEGMESIQAGVDFDKRRGEEPEDVWVDRMNATLARKEARKAAEAAKDEQILAKRARRWDWQASQNRQKKRKLEFELFVRPELRKDIDRACPPGWVFRPDLSWGVRSSTSSTSPASLFTSATSPTSATSSSGRSSTSPEKVAAALPISDAPFVVDLAAFAAVCAQVAEDIRAL